MKTGLYALVLATLGLSLGASLPPQDSGIAYLPDGVELQIHTVKKKYDWFIPYESVQVRLAFTTAAYKKHMHDARHPKIYFSPKSRINGTPILESELKRMNLNGFSHGTGEKRIRGASWYHTFGSGGIIPRIPGTHHMELILTYPDGEWHVPPFDLIIDLPESDAEAFKAFQRSACLDFVECRRGMRRNGRGDKPIKYQDVIDFITRYPESKLLVPLQERAISSQSADRQHHEGTYHPDDRNQIARILALIDGKAEISRLKRSIKSYEEKLAKVSNDRKVYYERRLRDAKDWLAMVQSHLERVAE